MPTLAPRLRPLPPVESPHNNHVNNPRPPLAPPEARVSASTAAWSTGLFYCFSDVPNCCLTCFCPCVTFGHIAEILDNGSISCGVSGALYTLLTCGTACCCVYSFLYRSKMRKQYILPEYPCGDYLVHLFCEPCALCQEYRELKNRDFDISTGWHGNAEEQNQAMVVTPVVQQGMGR